MSVSAPKKILLVDDNSMFLKVMERAFKKFGFKCFVSLSAEEAIFLLESELIPDIILSDYQMTGMNGLDFRKYLMNRPEFKDIPFVFLTYFSDQDLVISGLDLKAIDYVIKETPVDVIVSKINNILSTIDTQRELSEKEIRKASSSLNFKSIPVSTPNIKGFCVDFWHSAFNNIPGGDFIDFIVVNERFNFIVLGDIMGKKWKAWFFTFGFLSYIRSAIRFAVFNEDYSVASILNKVNGVLCFDDMLKDILSSLSLIMVDTETGVLSYAGAGDLPLLCYKHAEKQMHSISSTGLLLGLFENGNFTEQDILLEKADRLFVFTDGMIDFADAAGNQSNYNGFSETLLKKLNNDKSFHQIKESLFSKGLKQQIDDRSIITIYKN